MDIYHILQLTAEGDRHKWYVKTKELANEYFRFVTGEGIDELLERYVRRENELEFKQRTAITQQVTPAWSNKINKAFKKVHRADNINKVIKVDNETNQKLLIDLSTHYKGNKSLEKYLQSSFDRYNMIDPNAYLVNTFEVSEDQSRPNQPLAIEYISRNVLNYNFKNDILQWIVLRDFVDVEVKPRQFEEIARFQLLFIGGVVKMTPISKDEAKLLGNPDKIITEETTLFVLNSRFYKIETDTNDLIVIPAKAFGYKEDLSTNGETFVSIWDEALPYYWKSLKSVSEFDLTTALNAFPIRMQYVPSCGANDCHKGYTGNGDECESCHGTGRQKIPTSAQDSLILTLPDNTEDLIAIGDIMSFQNPNVDMVKWQQDYIRALQADAMGAIFNSETLVKTTVVTTATEQNNQKDNINDPLLGYAEGFSEMYKFGVRSTAANFNIASETVIVAYEFPKHFKFETESELIVKFDSAVKAGAPPSIKGAIAKQIAAKTFIDDPRAKLEFDVEQELRPFSNELDEKVERKIALNMVNKSTAFLWANFSDIICVVKIEDDTFFFRPRGEQKQILLDKAIELDDTNVNFDPTGG